MPNSPIEFHNCISTRSIYQFSNSFWNHNHIVMAMKSPFLDCMVVSWDGWLVPGVGGWLILGLVDWSSAGICYHLIISSGRGANFLQLLRPLCLMLQHLIVHAIIINIMFIKVHVHPPSSSSLVQICFLERMRCPWWDNQWDDQSSQIDCGWNAMSTQEHTFGIIFAPFTFLQKKKLTFIL